MLTVASSDCYYGTMMQHVIFRPGFPVISCGPGCCSQHYKASRYLEKPDIKSCRQRFMVQAMPPMLVLVQLRLEELATSPIIGTALINPQWPMANQPIGRLQSIIRNPRTPLGDNPCAVSTQGELVWEDPHVNSWWGRSLQHQSRPSSPFRGKHHVCTLTYIHIEIKTYIYILYIYIFIYIHIQHMRKT